MPFGAKGIVRKGGKMFKVLRVIFLMLVVVMFCFTTGNAQKPSFGLKGGIISQTFGYADESESQTWPVFGGLIEFSSPGLPFAIRGDFGFSWHSEKDEYSSLSHRDISIIAEGKYNKRIQESPIGFYFGAGPGLHLFNEEAKVEYGGYSYSDSESKTWIGLHFFGGIEYSSGFPTYFGEFGWGKIFPDNGSWSQFVFTGGICF